MNFQLIFTATLLCISVVKSEEATDGEDEDYVEPGGVYTRWGSSTCPTHSEKVYDGHAAGKKYNAVGSGSNFLCLPKFPEWNKYASGNSPGTGKIFGVEFEIHNEKPYPKSLFNRMVLCAVCKSTWRPTILMIPAKTSCPKHWHLEYRGYIMAESDGRDRNPSQYVCVDENPEKTKVNNKNQGVMYPIEAICGSLDCKVYGGKKELACVVCSQ